MDSPTKFQRMITILDLIRRNVKMDKNQIDHSSANIFGVENNNSHHKRNDRALDELEAIGQISKAYVDLDGIEHLDFDPKISNQKKIRANLHKSKVLYLP